VSGVDQPLVIANSCYHTGHERSWLAAEEQGFVREEGLDRYVYQRGGLIPGEWEPFALGRQMWERGVDIATAVNVGAAITQRVRGEDIYIVGGWRVQSAPRLIGGTGITRVDQLKGTRAIIRERWGMHQGVLITLQSFGLAPDDIEWIEDRSVAYGAQGADERFRAGETTLFVGNSRSAARFTREGYHVVLNLAEVYSQLASWPPGRVIVATRRTIEERGDALRATLRANLRGFWFSQDARNRDYMNDLETRQRSATFNDDERAVRNIRADEDRGPEDPLEIGGSMVMDGLVLRPALARVIEGMVQTGLLDRAIDVDDVLRDDASLDACQSLLDRRLIDAAELRRWRAVKGPRSVGNP
jgi:ABC-type nitrate/sulfonate/bicarbonate transport system substrate-binding protein